MHNLSERVSKTIGKGAMPSESHEQHPVLEWIHPNHRQVLHTHVGMSEGAVKE